MTNLRADLRDTPWPDPDAELHTDGSNFMAGRTRYAGAAVITHDKVLWAQDIDHGTSAQRAELIALTQALRWGKNKAINKATLTAGMPSPPPMSMGHDTRRGAFDIRGKEH